MPDTWIIDLRHFLAPSGSLAPELLPPARRLAEYCTAIAAQGSNFDEPVNLRCRRRPGHRRCTGVLSINLGADLEEFVWRCPSCGDNGVIRGWQGTFWDLSGAP